MAKAFFDDEMLDIPCPDCGKNAEKSVRWLKANKKLTCSGCGQTIDLQSDQFRREIAKAEKSIADFMKKFR